MAQSSSSLALQLLVLTNRIWSLLFCSHPDFGAYHKCNFRLLFQPSVIQQQSRVKHTHVPVITPQTPVRVWS